MRTLGWCHIQSEKGKERKKSIQICIFEIWPTLQPLKPPALLVRRSSHIAICSGYQVTCESFTSPAPQRLLLIISHGVRPPQPESLKCFIYLTSDLSHVTWLLIFNSWRIYTTQRGGEREMHWITLFTHLSSLSAFPNENGAFFLPLTGIISQLTNETSNYSFFFFLFVQPLWLFSVHYIINDRFQTLLWGPRSPEWPAWHCPLNMCLLTANLIL